MVDLSRYTLLHKDPKICGGRVVVRGFRIEPYQVVVHGVEDAVKLFGLTIQQYNECEEYMKDYIGLKYKTDN